MIISVSLLFFLPTSVF